MARPPLHAVTSGGDIVSIGFHKLAGLTKRYGAGYVITALKDKSLPNAFERGDYELSGLYLSIKSAEDRYKYALSTDAGAPGSGFHASIPSMIADGATKNTFTIVKQDADGTAMNDSTDNETLKIKTEVGSTSGNIVTIGLTSGMATMNLTPPTTFAIGKVYVENEADRNRKADMDIQAN